MEKLVVAAVEEIAAEGPRGCDLARLWSLIQCTPAAAALGNYALDDHIKQQIWRSLLLVPGLSITNEAGDVYHPSLVQSLESSQSLGLVVIASQELRDGCLGLYDIRHADTQPSRIQHAILERLASARSKGVTQNELGKEFKVEGNKLFYILRSLESRGLIVRKSILLRNNKNNSSIVVTNLVHLTRYALNLPLNSHQRLEANSAEDTEQGPASGEKQLMVNDDLPAMKAICEKLQEADGNVLVVSDLKLTLGYRLAAGHRAWRRLVKRLEEGGYVTTIKAKVGRKEKPCLHLLRPFSEHEQQSSGAGDNDIELKGPKRGQVTEQLVELSVDQHIYEMIDNGGDYGLTMMEVWKRIGLNNKRNYYRIQNMTVKHGLQFEAENHKRSTIYRLRTPKRKRADSDDDKDEGREHEGGPDTPFKIEIEQDGNAIVSSLQQPGAATPSSPADATLPAAAFPPPSLFRKGQAYPCISITTTSLQREKRVLMRLQEEKFLVRAELHKWLESISSQKTMMDRKTLIRTLEKLQNEGKCKCVTLEIPGTTNCGRKRKADIVLLPSLELDFDLLNAIHERIRKFEVESRVHNREKAQGGGSAAVVLTGLKRMKVETRRPPIDASTKSVALQDNGYIPAKMVRVRMLHHFLWSYTNNQEIGNGYRIFALTDALLMMPLELFLQVVGSSKCIPDLADRCRQGTLLWQLSPSEQRALMDTTAGGRLAWVIDILRRLKLIRFAIDYGHLPVAGQARDQFGSVSLTEHALAYAVDEHIYIQEPPPPSIHGLTTKALVGSLARRHDFNILHEKELHGYWEYLEYFYSGADPNVARRVFPGSNVPEVFGLRSWTSLRVMTMDQRNELFKRLNDVGRMSVTECAKVAKELNLTLQQVLRFSYEKNRKIRLQSLRAAENFIEAFTGSTEAPYERSPSVEFKQLSTIPDEDVSGGDDDQVNHVSVFAKLKPARSRFAWSDNLDRILVFTYAKQRALLGHTLNRVTWLGLKDLPAPAATCRRRISTFKSDLGVKKALLNLCSLVAARYEKYCSLEDQEGGVHFDPDECDMTGFKEAENRHYSEYYWDNPRDPVVASAIDEVIRCKTLLRASYSRQSHKKCSIGSTSKETLKSMNDIEPMHLLKVTEELQVPARPHRGKKLVKKAKKAKPASLQSMDAEEIVRNSLGAANAVEFIKLILLNTSINDGNVEVPKMFLDGLHQFQASDVFAAYTYLMDRNMVTSGEGAESFNLSDQFHFCLSTSQFPSTTCSEVMAFSKWLEQHESEIEKNWVPYDIEENRGQLLHLFGKVTTGELRLTPRLPVDGIGETDDPTSIGCSIKRKLDCVEVDRGVRTVRARINNQEDVFQAARRERGFPHIASLVHREALSLSDLLHLARADDDDAEQQLLLKDSGSSETENGERDGGVKSCDGVFLEAAMRAIEKGGENGLSIKELATHLGMTENPWDLATAERYIDELELNGRVRRVNAYDHVRAVSRSHSEHYVLNATERPAEDGVGTFPIFPWFTSTGGVNTKLLNDLSRQVVGIVTSSPGIYEKRLVHQIDVLNPQTAKSLIDMLVMDGKLIMKSTILAPVVPVFLGSLINPVQICHKLERYYFVNSLDIMV